MKNILYIVLISFILASPYISYYIGNQNGKNAVHSNYEKMLSVRVKEDAERQVLIDKETDISVAEIRRLSSMLEKSSRKNYATTPPPATPNLDDGAFRETIIKTSTIPSNYEPPQIPASHQTCSVIPSSVIGVFDKSFGATPEDEVGDIYGAVGATTEVSVSSFEDAIMHNATICRIYKSKSEGLEKAIELYNKD